MVILFYFLITAVAFFRDSEKTVSVFLIFIYGKVMDTSGVCVRNRKNLSVGPDNVPRFECVFFLFAAVIFSLSLFRTLNRLFSRIYNEIFDLFFSDLSVFSI